MKRNGVVVLTFNAPDTQEFLDWAQGPHMEDVGKIPGITRVRRFQVVEGPDDRRQFLSIIETDDIDATMAYRATERGKQPRLDADERGVTNRYSLQCREIFSKTFTPGK